MVWGANVFGGVVEEESSKWTSWPSIYSEAQASANWVLSSELRTVPIIETLPEQIETYLSNSLLIEGLNLSWTVASNTVDGHSDSLIMCISPSS